MIVPWVREPTTIAPLPSAIAVDTRLGSQPGDVTARCLIILTPPDFAPYFRELSAGLALAPAGEDGVEVRRRLSTKFDIEVVGPPIQP